MIDLSTDSSLLEIVSHLQRIDQGIEEVTPEQHAALGEVIRTKVDRCVGFIKEIEERIARHKSYEDEHKDARKHLEAHLARFQEYIVYTMKTGQFEKLPGDEFMFGIRRSEETFVSREPTAEDAEQLPEFCKTKVSYQWDKTAIKAAIKADRLPVGIAGIKINNNLTVKVK